MLFSELIHKTVYAGISPKGKCVGIGVSLKSYAVKYLLCSSTNKQYAHADFCINVAAIDEIEDGIFLTHLRPAFPKNCAKLFLGLPIYAENGTFIGNLYDVQIENFQATHLLTNNGTAIPICNVSAVFDAILLKKQSPYPIGQRIPAPSISRFLDKDEPFISKSTLRTAIKKSNLIKLTLSLPPFAISPQNEKQETTRYI